jgi:hypothetical protein
MSWAAATVIWIAVTGVAAYVAVMIGRAYGRYRGTRLVECPETREIVAVEVNAVHAAVGAPLGKADLRLSECTRWPERQGCGQECLRQIEASPEGCLVRTIVTDWYKGKTCTVCGTRLDVIDWYERKPALAAPDGRTVQWSDVAPERLPQVLADHAPLCWNCHVTESFRRQHPDLVLDNPWKTTGGTTRN